MVAVVFTAGVQLPGIAGLFVELDGKVKEPPEQIAAIGLNVGVTFALTVTKKPIGLPGHPPPGRLGVTVITLVCVVATLGPV